MSEHDAELVGPSLEERTAGRAPEVLFASVKKLVAGVSSARPEGALGAAADARTAVDLIATIDEDAATRLGHDAGALAILVSAMSHDGLRKGLRAHAPATFGVVDAEVQRLDEVATASWANDGGALGSDTGLA